MEEHISFPIVAHLTITHIERGLPLGLPYIIFIDGRPVGMLQMPQARMQLPEGKHTLTVKCGGYLPFFKKTLSLFVEASETIECPEGEYTAVTFENRERWWNILFDVDMALWVVRMFVTLPEPWGLVYDICSNVAFAVWLLHFYLYRKRYFKFKVTHQSTPPDTVLPSKLQRKMLEWRQKHMIRS